MKKAVNFWLAFFLALGAMISFPSRPGKAREALLQQPERKSGIAQHFASAWNHLATAAGNYE